METIKTLFSLSFFILILTLTGCGGGGGTGDAEATVFSLDGGRVSGTSNSESAPPLYSFDVVAGTPYTIALVNTSGETAIYAYNFNPYSVSQPIPFDISWTAGNYETVSFIANTTGTVYFLAIGMGANVTTTYTFEATTNNLIIGAAARSDTVYGGGGMFASPNLYYSFDAQVGTAYEVRVTPTQGDVDIIAVSVNADMSSSVGASSNTGTSTDFVFFEAIGSQQYYIKVKGASDLDSIFDISIHEVPNSPDLSVIIDSAVSDGTNNIVVNYTIYNNGATDFTGNVQSDIWANSSVVPTVGSTANTYNTHTAVTIAALGGTLSASVTIANSDESGAAYVVVDTLEAVVEGNENNNVSSAVSWEKPLSAPMNIDFEDSVISSKMVMSGDANWQIDSTTGGNGSSTSLRSGTIGDSQISCVSMSAYNSKLSRISFDRRVSSDYFYDDMKFYIDNVEWTERSGEIDWSGEIEWSNVSYGSSISVGLHDYKWCYRKNVTGASGSDAAWIDNIVIEEIPLNLGIAIKSAIWDGENVVITYDVNNTSLFESGTYEIDFWSSKASAPITGDTGELRVVNASIAASSLYSGVATVPATSISGLSYAIIDTTGALNETYLVDNISSYAITDIIPDLSVEITGAWSDGADVLIHYTVTSTDYKSSPDFTVSFLSDAGSPPSLGDTMESTVSHTSLAGNSSVTGSLTIANSSASGIAYAIVNNDSAFVESDDTNNMSSALWEISPVAPISYGFEDSVLPIDFKMSGDADWAIVQYGVGNSAIQTLKSGAIADSQSSCTSISVLSNSSISFDYIVSTRGGDLLYFYVDDILPINFWPKATDAWVTYTDTLANGPHVYKWCYKKDSSLIDRSDAVFIDNITFN